MNNILISNPFLFRPESPINSQKEELEVTPDDFFPNFSKFTKLQFEEAWASSSLNTKDCYSNNISLLSDEETGYSPSRSISSLIESDISSLFPMDTSSLDLFGYSPSEGEEGTASSGDMPVKSGVVPEYDIIDYGCSDLFEEFDEILPVSGSEFMKLMDKGEPEFQDLVLTVSNTEEERSAAPAATPQPVETDKCSGSATDTKLYLFPVNQNSVNIAVKQEKQTYDCDRNNDITQMYQAKNPTSDAVSLTGPTNSRGKMIMENSNYGEQNGSESSRGGHKRKERVTPRIWEQLPAPLALVGDDGTLTVEQTAEDTSNQWMLPVNTEPKRKGRKRSICSVSTSVSSPKTKPKKPKMYENPDKSDKRVKSAYQAKLNREKNKKKVELLEERCSMVDQLEAELLEARKNEEYLRRQLEASQKESTVSSRLMTFKAYLEETVTALNRIYGGPTTVELPERLDCIKVRVTDTGEMNVVNYDQDHQRNQLPSISEAFNPGNIQFDYNSLGKKAIFKYDPFMA